MEARRLGIPPTGPKAISIAFHGMVDTDELMAACTEEQLGILNEALSVLDLKFLEGPETKRARRV
eukprot:629842-Amphidinium_carterae.1